MTDTPWSTLAAAITRLNDRIDALPSIREATVTAASPLAVTFDTDTTATLAHGTLAAGLVAGDRVLTLKLRHYVWALGKKGGQPFPTPSPYRAAAGTTTTSAAIAANGNLAVNITFPAGRFTQPPILTGNCGNARGTIGFDSITTSGAVMSVSNWSDGSMASGQSLYWHAVQMTPDSAAG